MRENKCLTSRAPYKGVTGRGHGPAKPLPVWATQPSRDNLDGLLGFLLSESKTETAHNGAQIRTSPTRPVRGDSAREAIPGSQGRARGPRGSSVPRDRSDAGQRKKRGEHP